MSGKCYSINEEEFNLDGIGEVIDSLRSYSPNEEQSLVGVKYWEADAIPYEHKDVISLHVISRLLYDLDCQLGDEIMDFEYLYIEAKADARKELQEVLLQWAEKHVTIHRYFKICNVVEKTIQQEDLDE